MTRVLFPAPETPVTAMKVSRGNATSTRLRLCSLAPSTRSFFPDPRRRLRGVSIESRPERYFLVRERADRVSWADISGVGAIAETTSPLIKAEPSQGSHFFHNITTMGINYINVSDANGDFFDWDWLAAIEPQHASAHVAHVKLDQTLTIKVDGRESRCVMYV